GSAWSSRDLVLLAAEVPCKIDQLLVVVNPMDIPAFGCQPLTVIIFPVGGHVQDAGGGCCLLLCLSCNGPTGAVAGAFVRVVQHAENVLVGDQQQVHRVFVRLGTGEGVVQTVDAKCVARAQPGHEYLQNSVLVAGKAFRG